MTVRFPSSGEAGEAGEAGARRSPLRPAAVGRALATGVTGLVLLLLILVVVRLPWMGDLGIHAATVQRLRHSPLAPGNPWSTRTPRARTTHPGRWCSAGWPG